MIFMRPCLGVEVSTLCETGICSNINFIVLSCLPIKKLDLKKWNYFWVFLDLPVLEFIVSVIVTLNATCNVSGKIGCLVALQRYHLAISFENRSNVEWIQIGKMLKLNNVLKMHWEIGGMYAWEIIVAQNCLKVSALRNVSHLLKKISWNAMVSSFWVWSSKLKNYFQRL